MKMIIVLILAALTMTVAPAASAQGEDHRACVSLREYRGADHAPQKAIDTRAELEIRWDVRGLGRRVPEVSDDVLTVRSYKACGFSRHEAAVWVWYRTRNDHTFSWYRGVEKHATLHGQERQAAS